MTKKQREIVFNKFDGRCAYTGKILEYDWQVDHVYSKSKHRYSILGDITKEKLKEVEHIDNLLPALKIVNHYKRSLDLEGFRHYMSYFHKRLAKLPKKTIIESTKKRKIYMQKVADAFNIKTNKPFDGKFYFEINFVV